MPTIINKYIKLSAGLLILLNTLPLIVVFLGKIQGGDIIYFYWAECALLGILTLVIHMKRLVVFLVLLIVAILIVKLSNYTLGGSPKISLTFWSLYCLLWLSYIEMGKSKYWQKIRRQHPLEQFTYYLLFMAISIMASFAMTATIYDGWNIIADIPKELYMLFLGLTVSVPTLSIGLLKIIDMIGPRHFLHFLFGTYHSPVEQERIVLFLDMVGSSSMAEGLEPKESLNVIARFIFDASAIFRRNGGDILNYTGDGLVVIWPRKQANRVFNAVKQLRATFDNNRPLYKEMFGFVPDFRIGMHAGTIVIGQIGEEKLFLGLYGDVVNTAARLEQMNKELKTKVLLSRVIANDLNATNMALLKPLGKKNIRGRNKDIEVFTLQEEE